MLRLWYLFSLIIKDKPNPLYISMNNGIFLCDGCAENHKTFGDKYSYVRSLINYEWDYTAYLYIELGDNDSFRLFMMQYGLMQELPEIRYKTLAAEYYRMKVFFNSTI